MLLLFIFTCWLIIEIAKMIRKRIKGTRSRFAPATTILMLLILTYLRPQNRIIEKIDWYIFYNKRNEIIRQVKNDELKPNCHTRLSPIFSSYDAYIIDPHHMRNVQVREVSL